MNRSKQPRWGNIGSKARRLARPLRLVLTAVVVVYGGYLVLINVLLLSGGLNWLLRELAPGLRLRTGQSFSVWFFRVELRDLHLSLMDSNLHLEVEAGRGSVQVRPDKLFTSTFHATHVAGSGFVFRLRPNYSELPQERRQALPDLTDALGPLIERETDPAELWGVTFQDLDLQFEEIWVSELRFVGSVQVRGGFALQPAQDLEIYESEIAFEAGELRFGADRAVARHLTGTVTARVPRMRFDQELPWRDLTARSKLAVELADASFINAYFEGPGTPPRISGGGLDAELNAVVERDEMDVRLETKLRGLAFGAGKVSTAAHGILSGRWRAKASQLPAGRLEQGVLDVSRGSIRHPDFRVEDWTFRLDVPELTIGSSPQDMHGAFFVAAEDARPVARLLGIQHLPEPLERFLTLPALRVVGRYHATHQGRELHFDRALSETIDVRGRLLQLPDRTHFALLLTADPLSVGVSKTSDEVGVNVLADDEWLQQELDQFPDLP